MCHYCNYRIGFCRQYGKIFWQSGCTFYDLLLTINNKECISKMESLINRKNNNSEEDRRIKILAVDDNIQNVELLEALLSSRGYELIRAYNGRGALQKVDEVLPYLILLDVL